MRMDFREIWLGMPTVDRRELASKVGSSYGYLQKLAGGFGMPSMEFADKLKQELPSLDLAGFIKARKQAGRRAATKH